MVKLNSYSTVYTVKIDVNTAGMNADDAEKAAWRLIHDSVVPAINRMSGVAGATIVNAGSLSQKSQGVTV